MKDGFIKVSAISHEVRVADCPFNAASVLKEIEKSAKLGASVIVCPELCITSYTASDAFLSPTLLDGAQTSLREIMLKTKDIDAIIFVGLPVKNEGNIYNAVAAISLGKILGVVPKCSVDKPFTAAPLMNSTITLCNESVDFGTNLLFTSSVIDGFTVGVEVGSDADLPIPPSAGLAAAGATIIVNPSASPAVVGKEEKRELSLCAHSRRLKCGYITSEISDGESTTDALYNGQNFIAERGQILNKSKLLESETIVSEIDIDLLCSERAKSPAFKQNSGYKRIYFSHEVKDTPLTRSVKKNPFLPSKVNGIAKNCELILNISARALAKRIKHTNAKAAVVGLSGGLDSCLALLIIYRAFEILGKDKKEIHAISMPCFGTSKRTKGNSEKMANALGVSFKTINIKKSVLQHFKDIGHDPSKTDITYENSQARERTQVLMDIANALGGMVIGTGDLSELALGWATYNGDQMSMYGVNASIPKTLVRQVVRAYADKADKKLKTVLLDILDTPVSPELLPAKEGDMSQKTEDLVGPYELHDFFIYHFIKHNFRPRKIYRLARIAFDGVYDGATVKKWLTVFLRRFFAQQFKRSCMPDGAAVGTLSLSPRCGLSLPSDAVSALWLNEVENITD